MEDFSEIENREKPCPKCGSYEVSTTGNLEVYPDHYETFDCGNCGFLIGLIDNSQYISCYEFENFEIDW